MRKLSVPAAAALMAVSLISSAVADVAIVVPKEYAYPPTNYLSSFAIDETDYIFTAGYSSNQELRWSHILNEANQPWGLEGGLVLNWFQLNLFALNGYPANSGLLSWYGMNYEPVRGKYFLEGLTTVRGPGGGEFLNSDRCITIFDPQLPDSLIVTPTHVTLSNAGGIYSLVDDSLDPNGESRAKFLSSGVQPGDRITLFPVDTFAAVKSDTYTITTVVNETTLYLDRDPVDNQTTATEVGYLLSVQPWVTLGTFRSVIPYYDVNRTTNPMSEYKGGFNADYSRLFVADPREGSIVSISTQTSESMTVFVSSQLFKDYVQAQVNAGRHMAVIQKYIYTDSFAARWQNQSVGATVDPNTILTDPNGVLAREGSKAIAVTYNAAGNKFVLYYDPNDPNNPPPLTADYGAVRFYMNGAATGGQSLLVNAVDPNGVAGPSVPMTLQANTWTMHEVATSALGVGKIGKLVWTTATGAQPLFYVDWIAWRYTDPPPPGIGDFDPNSGKVMSTQIATDRLGRVWCQESQTRDILWTSDGTTLHTFITSNEIWSATHGNEASSSGITQGVQAQGFILDKMGTVYWGDNATPKCFYKLPACGGAENLRIIATPEQVKAATGLSPAGMNCFWIRGTQLLTFQFSTGAFIYKVDLNTYDYGDFSGDLDVDGEDFNLFAQAMAGPGVTTPPAGCDPVLFQHANLDQDSPGDADLADYARLQRFATGALP